MILMTSGPKIEEVRSHWLVLKGINTIFVRDKLREVHRNAVAPLRIVTEDQNGNHKVTHRQKPSSLWLFTTFKHKIKAQSRSFEFKWLSATFIREKLREVQRNVVAPLRSHKRDQNGNHKVTYRQKSNSLWFLATFEDKIESRSRCLKLHRLNATFVRENLRVVHRNVVAPLRSHREDQNGNHKVTHRQKPSSLWFFDIFGHKISAIAQLRIQTIKRKFLSRKASGSWEKRSRTPAVR